jgi:Tol biopolymer transport system component
MLRGSIMTRPLDMYAQVSTLAKEGALPIWSPDATRLAFLRTSSRILGLWTVNAAGEEKQLVSDDLAAINFSILPYQRLDARYFDWSPDSARIVYCSRKNQQRNLCVVAADGSSDVQLTNNTDDNLDIRCPVWSADGHLIAYSSGPVRIGADRKVSYGVWVIEPQTKNSRIVFEADYFFRLIGWSQSGEELILAAINGKVGTLKPTEIQLHRVSVKTGQQQPIATLEAAYLYNIHLSADKRMIAYSSHREDKDNIWLVSADGGQSKKLTSNNDSRLYFSSLAWSPDGRAVYYGKQIRYSHLWMITNFD